MKYTTRIIGFLSLLTLFVVTDVANAQVCVPPPAGLVSWLPMDGSVIDIVDGNNPSATNALSFVPGKVATGVTFGADGFIDIPHSANLATQRFTIDAWVKPEGPGPNNDQFGSIIVVKAMSSGTNVPIYLGWSELDNTFLFIFGNMVTERIVTANTFPPGSFYHVAATYDGATFKLYVNGSLEAQRDAVKTISYDASFPWNIGSAPSDRRGSFARTWNGVIDEVEIYNRALSASEIQAIFNADSAGTCKPDGDGDGVADKNDACPATPAGTAVNAAGCPANQCLALRIADGGADLSSSLGSWWPLDETTGTIANDVTDATPGTLTGTTSVAGKVSNARRFVVPGNFVVPSGDVMIADGSGTLDISGNQVTIDGWIKLENNPTGSQTFAVNIGKVTYPASQAYLLSFESPTSALGLPPNQWMMQYVLTNGSGTRVHNQNTGVVVTVNGQYHHFALTYDGSNVRLYVDGTLQATFPFSGNLKSVPGEPVTINSGGGLAPFSADEVEIFNRALSASEIQAIFLAGSAGKCKLSNQPPVAEAGQDRTVECTSPADTNLILDGSASSDPELDPLTYTWTGPFETTSGRTAIVSLPIGTHEVTLTVDDGQGVTDSDTATMVVEDTTPPTIDSLDANPKTLWPPNHQMVSASVAAAVADTCDAAPTCQIIAGSSNEPVDGQGRGDRAPDWEITGASTAYLRAERSARGNGRVYTLTVECVDASGNASSSSVDITVPHDQWK